MRIAVAQMTVSGDKRANVSKISELAVNGAQQGAELIVFPEASMYHFGPPRHNLSPHAEPVDGPFVAHLAKVANLHKVWIAAGMFEAIPGDRQVFNTIVVVNSSGELVGTYRKIHLFDALGWRESERIKSGDGDILLFRAADITFGVMTCYDVRFPELARTLASRGANVVLMPSAWVRGPMKESQFEMLVRARAIENNLYLAASSQIGQTFCGNSMIVDPMGFVLCSLGEQESVASCDILIERFDQVRGKSPTLRNCRPDLYCQWYAQMATQSSGNARSMSAEKLIESSRVPND